VLVTPHAPDPSAETKEAECPPDRVALAVQIGSVTPTGHVYDSKGMDACQKSADALLASEWLAEHDRRILADRMAARAGEVGR
jgi:hypothetical protein